MEPLKIIAHLRSGFVATDDYSPDLGSILEYCWLVERNLFTPNPDPNNIILPDLPVAKNTLGNDWLWAISSPVYSYTVESVERCRKRWDADANYPVKWGKRRANIQTDGGPFKSGDLPVVVRLTNEVYWYSVGEKSEIEILLQHCKGVGGRRAAGFGQVQNWEVSKHNHDWSLWRGDQLMAPIPHRLLDIAPTDCRNMRWNVRAPRWNTANADVCYMPKGLVVKNG